MGNFWNIVNNVIKEANVLLIVVDARNHCDINNEILDKIKIKEKEYIVIFNKSDLLSEKELEEVYQSAKKHENYAVLSATNHFRTMALLRKINSMVKGENATVGVIGYPNTGKSSLINALKGRQSAPVSSQAGYTKGLQKIRVTKNINLLDSPGVISSERKEDFTYQGIYGAKSPNQMKDPEGASYKLISKMKEKVANFYGIKVGDEMVMLEDIAFKMNFLKRGGEADEKKAAIKVLEDWQKGKMSS